MRFRRMNAVAVLAALAMLASACGGDDSDEDTSGQEVVEEPGADAGEDASADDGEDASGEDATEDPGADGGEEAASEPCTATVPGTEIDWADFYPAFSYDPPLSSGSVVGGTQMLAIYDTLIRWDEDTNQYVPHLAESMESNEDHTEWTLKLREGITYDDGTPLDAQLVLDNLARFSDPSVSNTAAAYVHRVVDTEVVDDLTIVFTLNEPWATFPLTFADEPGMIANLNALEADPEGFGQNPPPEAGVGPYILEEKVPGEVDILRARDNYWGGPVCIERVRFATASATGLIGGLAAYDALKNGDLDAAMIRDERVLAQIEADGTPYSSALQDSGYYVLMNLGEGRPLSDPVLREAIALAIDADVINDRAYNSTLEAGKIFFAERSPFWSPDMETMDTDPDRARELVAQSGFTGTLQIVCAASEQHLEFGITLAAQLEAIGIASEVENLPNPTPRYGEGTYDLACYSLNLGPDTTPIYLSRFTSDSNFNRLHVKDPEYDRLVAEVLAVADDEEALREALTEWNNHMAANFYGVPIGPSWEILAHSPELKGLLQTHSTLFMLHDAYLEE